MIALFVKILGHFQNIAGTVFHTKRAPLAAIFNDKYIPFGNLNVFIIQRFTPVFYICAIVYHNICKPCKVILAISKTNLIIIK
jgi:hypothetical protein